MINFHFFGRECYIDKELKERQNLQENLTKLNFNFSDILLLNQVHGNDVVVIADQKQIYGIQDLPKADGIVTNLSNLAIGIVTADCAPILLYDNEQQIIGACHAGWRGAKSGIIESTIKAMKKLGANDIKASIGPTIQQYSYQISQEFYDDFISLDASSSRFFKADKVANKWLFNLPTFIENKLSQCGVLDIDNLEIDTYTNVKNYFSYRRASHFAQDLDGRNVSIICIN